VVSGPTGEGPRTLLAVADDWRRDIAFGRLEHLTFAATDGTPLEAWLQHPAGHPANAPLPVILHVHGGPHWPIGERFVFEHRRLAEQGYRVLSMNPRGATGYGEAYAQANVGDWGGIDASDLLCALDVVCARDDVDASRQAVTGESYGGFMTNWLVATTTRFRAAVAQNSITDLWGAYLTTDDPTSFDWDLGGRPWEQPERYERLSPLRHVAAIRTPLLLIHSELDRNCPIGQAEQLASALRLLGRPVELVRIPGEGHLINLVGRPSSRLARIAATDRFLAQHLGPAAPGAA
jgi:dipeptidyl aminopeptidase/acylaminoacyl peptidase